MSGRILIRLMIVAIALAPAACDRRPVASLPSTAPTQPVLELELKPLTPLLPNRMTHVAVDPLGNIYWVQETDRADDTLFVIGEGDIPRATQLSVANIAAAMDAPGGRGNIQGLAAGPGGELYFFFSGTAGRRTLAGVGQFVPKTAQIRILADADALAAATGMGLSLPLARGSVVSDVRNVWVWVRHTDTSAIFRFDPRALPRGGPIRLMKQFDAVTFNGKPIALTREEYELSAGPDGTLMLLDPVAGRLIKIRGDGTATLVRSLLGLPKDLSTPAFDRRGQMLLFAANAELIRRSAASDGDNAVPATAPPPLPKFDATFPAMLIFDGETLVTHIGRDDVLAYPGFPVFGMRLRQLVPHPSDEAWISYDAGSGELLRVKIHEKSW